MQSIPVTILGGSDGKPGMLPESGAGLHPLATYKGVAIRVGGRPLVAWLVERLAQAEGFGPVAVAGPARVYGPLGLGVELVDTDGSVGENLRAAIEAHRRARGGPLGIMACDVLPSRVELERLRREYEEARPCALCLPFVRVPSDPRELGAFSWKPVYRVVPEGASEAVRILPGHLGICEPEALRLPLLYRLLGAAYRTRNHSVAYRRAVMLRMVLLSLLLLDARLLVSLRAPTRTVTVVGSGLRLARELRRGEIRQADLEQLVGRILLRAAVPHEGSLRLPITDCLGLAEDADTEEEALQIVREAEARHRGEARPAAGS